MSNSMSVDKDRFNKLEREVVDISHRLAPLEVAVPSIDDSLKKLVELNERVAVNNAKQEEWNKNTREKIDSTDKNLEKLSTKVESNGEKIIKIVIWLAAGGLSATGAAKLLGL